MFDSEEKFTHIYNRNGWHGRESISGKGSGLDQTKTIREELPRLFNYLEIKSILDCPCGDCYWMDLINLGNILYIGGDIVQDLIHENRERHHDRVFIHLDIIHSPLPKMDLILCRDCLVHFSDADILRALENIKASESNYLLTTNFLQNQNQPDIVTGEGWRPLNLCLPPFNLLIPMSIINERCLVPGFEDKSLAVWKINTLERN